MSVESSPRLTVASNRLPVGLTRDGEGDWMARPSTGGLVRAMRPVLGRWGGSWVGWSGACGVPGGRLRALLGGVGEAFDLEPVALDESERDRYYLGFSNRMLWPFLHGLPGFAEPRKGDWDAYRTVNGRFAGKLASCGAGPIWVHDYHLMLVAAGLRRRGCRRPVGFFLHTPFPGPDTLHGLPQWRILVRALARFDRLGFQTERDRWNFLEAAEAADAVEVVGSERRPAGDDGGSLADRTGAFPISIDARSWSRRSAVPEIARRAARIRARLNADILLLGVDRLDYTKGIPARLKGWARALDTRPELRGRATLRQLAVPSREQIPAYAEIARRVEGLVDRINRRFGTSDWTPVEYIHGRWDDDELVAQYRAADVALVTPLRDGMNLVAKEYCAASTGEPGVLILSRSAGSAAQLGAGAILVDPRDERSVAEAIVRAVSLSPEEKRCRMSALRRSIEVDDVHAWASDFLGLFRAASGGRMPPPPPSTAQPSERPRRRREGDRPSTATGS